MELLPKLTLKDHIHHAIALLGVCISAILAVFALQEMRAVIRSLCVLWQCRRTQVRLAEIVMWIVMGVLFALFIMAIQPAYTGGVTKSRVTRAQGRGIPSDVAQNGFKRWLWKNDLYLTAVSFVKTVWIPIAVFIIAYLVNEILINIVLG